MSALQSITKGVRTRPHFVLLYGVDGVGKCLGKGTPVMRADGSCAAVETIRPGDFLMGPDSRPRKVIGTTRGTGPLYRVDCKKGESFVCNDAHQLTIGNSNAKERGWTEISAADYSLLPDYKRRYLPGVRVGVEFPEASLPLDPYFVGLWIGDGTLRGGAIRITKPGSEIHAAVTVQATAFGLQSKRYDDGGVKCGSSGIIAGERAKGEYFRKLPESLKSAMKELGWKGDEKTIPTCYLRSSRSQRLELLAGLIDTDGHLIHNCFEISTKYKGLSEAVTWLARSLGLQATCRLKKSSIKEINFTGYYYRIFISGHTNTVPTRNPKKQAPPRTQVKDPGRFGMNVSPIGEGEYFGFEVDGDHRFLLGDFTVTHNSSFGAAAPKPVFLGPEDGLGLLDVAKFPTPENWAKVKSCVSDLLHEEHDYQTLVIDSIDWIEPLVWAHVVKEDKEANSIENVGGGFGKGYVYAREQWQEFIELLQKLRAKMNIVAIAHAQIKSADDPYENERYDRYIIKMNDKASDIWREAVDCVFFANFDIRTSKEKGAKKAKAFGDGKRVMFTERRPAFDAKNRFDLPFIMELSWDAFVTAAASAVPSGEATEDKLLVLFKGKETEAVAYLVHIGWLLEGQSLTDLKAAKRKPILSRPDDFLKAVTDFHKPITTEE